FSSLRLHLYISSYYFFSTYFFFIDTATTEIYTLSLHDALPISRSYTRLILRSSKSGSGPRRNRRGLRSFPTAASSARERRTKTSDRKSTRLNSSHLVISYAVFCLKKKKKNNNENSHRRPTSTFD